MNKHGLSRDIPDDIKREVRKRDGFGCVYCGGALFDYEHLTPPFADATKHTIDGIILLCPNCHRKKGTFLTNEVITAAAANPKCRQTGFSFGTFNLGAGHPEVRLGNLHLRRTSVIVEVSGEDILSVEPPELAGGPFRISANLYGPDGVSILKIHQNEWRTPIENWDVEIIGGKISIRQKIGKIILVLKCLLPNTIVFERMDLIHHGTEIRINSNMCVEVVYSGKVVRAASAIIEDSPKGLVVTSGGI